MNMNSKYLKPEIQTAKEYLIIIILLRSPEKSSESWTLRVANMNLNFAPLPVVL